MLSVAVHKDIAEYQPKVVGKMTGRTLASIAGALGCSVLTGLYIYFVLGWNVGDNMMLIYAVSLPFWCCGFIRPKGMPFEQFAALWLKANFGVERIKSFKIAYSVLVNLISTSFICAMCVSILSFISSKVKISDLAKLSKVRRCTAIRANNSLV